MKLNILTSLCALALVGAFSCLDAATPRASAQKAPCPKPFMQFVMGQNFLIETVTCDSWFAHYDLHNYGSIEGHGCVTTGPLLQEDGTGGHISVSFDFTDGSTLSITGCTATTSLLPGWDQVSVTCTHG